MQYTNSRFSSTRAQMVMGQALEVGRSGCALMHSYMAQVLVRHANGDGAEADKASGAEEGAAGV